MSKREKIETYATGYIANFSLSSVLRGDLQHFMFVTFILIMPLKHFSVLLFCLVWITVMFCSLVLQNTFLKNSRQFRTMLLDLSFAVPNLIMSPLSFSDCNGFMAVRELITRFLLFISKSLNRLLPLTSLISYMFACTPISFVLHLMIDFSVFLMLKQSRMVNALSLIRDGAGIAQLVVLGLTVHSVAGSILLWGHFLVEGIFPLELIWVQTPFPQNSFG